MINIVYLALLLFQASHVISECHDVDPDACILMHDRDPAICENTVVASTVCAKFCDYCLATCYVCNNVVANASDCTTQKQCAHGELCFMATFRSAVDGHHEYKMNCASFEHCEGQQFLSLLGRRGIESRTISTECCSEHLCNNPAFYTTTTSTKTTTAEATTPHTTTIVTPTHGATMGPPHCVRDVEILVQDANGQTNTDRTNIKRFLRNFTGLLTLEKNETYAGAGLFSGGVHWNTGLLSSNATLHQKLGDIHFEDHHPEVEIQRVLDESFKEHLGPHDHPQVHDRPHVKNVLILVFDSSAHAPPHHPPMHMPPNIDDVIVVSVGSSNLIHEFAQLASGSDHLLHVADYDMLATLNSQLLSLICQ